LSLLSGAMFTQSLKTSADSPITSIDIIMHPGLPPFANQAAGVRTLGQIIKASDGNYYMCLVPHSNFNPGSAPDPNHWLNLTTTPNISFQENPPVIFINRQPKLGPALCQAGDYVFHNGQCYLAKHGGVYYDRVTTPGEWCFCRINPIGNIKRIPIDK
jgi:hypothetical protein